MFGVVYARGEMTSAQLCCTSWEVLPLSLAANSRGPGTPMRAAGICLCVLTCVYVGANVHVC